ncbi:hypothetical protein HYO65_gp133 [Tenacibaculum phage PTm1]|uniref:Uncharacterized protein n=2 Tax=Shirahamavirus PTm1 TaxID=2846435 RepID=A0A5S9EQJ0_9CAUD|nr:hypothetical protein HYO65_gp133 [Tenacibaculum phage PTm1]BBI90525.1 hypothetical protein [Tenacibaculum phage PTm1]BBI90833.1 hypothetical protein [Tenacibaculum phage PTm5]
MKNKLELELVSKCWELNLDKILHGDHYNIGDFTVHTDVKNENRNDAKTKIMKDIHWLCGLNLNDNDETEVTYLNIPIKRCKVGDKFLFEGEPKSKYQIEEILKERKRIDELKKFAEDNKGKFCYIQKYDYYKPNRSGYTQYRTKAGVYEVADAVDSAIKCRDLSLVLIDIDEHNKNILEEIEDLKTRLL